MAVVTVVVVVMVMVIMVVMRRVMRRSQGIVVGCLISLVTIRSRSMDPKHISWCTHKESDLHILVVENVLGMAFEL
jgi:MFS superfamily sulfate permease-like transporter